MNGKDLYRAIGGVDDEVLEQSEAVKKKMGWLKWCAAAACFCLILMVIIASRTEAPEEPIYAQTHLACSFRLDRNTAAPFFPIGLDDCIRYGLVPEDAISMNQDNLYKITKADLGKRMGTAVNCLDESINGSKVYHFAKYPEYDTICIVKTPKGYAFYTCPFLDVDVEIGGTSDLMLSAYGLPDSTVKMEILDGDNQSLFDIEDAADIKAIFELLSGKINIGDESKSRRYAQAWYKAYGNNDVYYSEEDGMCEYKDSSCRDKANELWSEGECQLRITTDRGFQVYIMFVPSIRIFIWGNGYYELSPKETEALSALVSK